MTSTRRLASLAAGSLLLAIGIRIPEIALPGAWIALALLLDAWRRTVTRSGVAVFVAALYAAMAIGNRGVVPASGPIYFALAAFLTLATLLPFLLDRWASRRIGGWASTLVFPAAFVAQEFLRSKIPGGPASWGALGYSQYGALPLMQLAAVTGVSGLSFLVAWFASAASAKAPRALPWCVAAIGAIALAGSIRLAAGTPRTATLEAAVVSFPPGLFTPSEMFRLADGRLAMTGSAAERIERLHEWFFEATEREARAGARLVAWPEMNFLVKAEDEPAALARAERLAAREGIFLSMGMGTVRAGAPKPFQNKTVLVDSRGSVAYSYLKSRPVMGWEDTVMQVGDGRLPIADTALGRVSSAICFEGDHAELARQAGRAGAELFLLPANDWREIKEIHLAMAAFRAVENGTPLLRPASGGVSAAFDAHGRLLGRTDHTTGPSTLVVEIPTGRVATLYARVGDLFAWLCVAGCALAPALAWRRAKARAVPAENVSYCATGSSA